ncbi:hypothetical protein B0H17DRAFT_564751 [Mycena rosella]|uniref:F-box domain-containing protein n=1 Tax=Mycena rosella TaxID=1033263 RepID=A0AAD7DGL2_MYCRO|nr:hypothetical protein B0H17DRAFT_564751 [Mycena rosella]
MTASSPTSERHSPSPIMRSSTHIVCLASFGSTPGDLLLEIAGYFESRSDLLSLCLTSKSFFSDIAPALYQSVVLTSAQQCTATLAMLKRRKDIARHVRELFVSPSRSNSYQDPSFLDSRAASVAVAEIAASRSLDALSKFTWSDHEIAYHEEMWLALRMCCPRLRYLSTSIGAYFPSSSHLFNFTDLLGFSLFLKPGFYENNAESLLDGMSIFILRTGPLLYIRSEEQIPSKRLWDMLFKRCPNLEELVIEGYSVFPAEARCLVDGRWPNLHKLALGDIAIDWNSTASPAAKGSFITFLEAHTELQSLGLSRHNIDSSQLNSLDPDALKLTSFSGTLTQVQALSPSYSSLTSLTLRDPVWSRDVTTMTISGLLQQLTSLTELNISFMLHSPYDSSSILRALISSCPQLQHLQLSCIRKTSFQLDALAKALPAFRRLRTLSLTLVSAGDLTLAAAGARIARANPRLASFKLAFVPPSYPQALPRRPLSPFPRTKKESGAFALECDAYGLPVALRVRESCTTVWPWGLGAARRVKQYTLDLRPPGSPGRTGKGGVMGILLESSAAGEEMRMFVFCSVLVCFAGAFVVKG